MSKILITNPKYKIKSKIHLWFKRIIIILFFILFGSIVYFLLFSPIFNVKKITFIEDGKEIIYPELLTKLDEILKNQNIFIFSGSNLIILNSKKLKQELLKYFSQLENLEIKKEFPNKLIINFSKRKLAMLICNLDCFTVDKNGIAFNRALKTEGFLFLKVKTDLDINIGQKIIDPNFLDFLMQIKEEVDQKIPNLTIEEFNLTKSNLKVFDTIAKTNENWYIYFDLLGNSNEEIDNLKKVLDIEIKENRKKLEYIDLRFGNKIFYKYKL